MMIPFLCASSGSIFRRQKRQAEARAAAEPGRRAIARVAIGLLHGVEDPEDVLRSDQIAELERSVRIVEAELDALVDVVRRSEEHTSELQSLMRSSYAVSCLQQKKTIIHN